MRFPLRRRGAPLAAVLSLTLIPTTTTLLTSPAQAQASAGPRVTQGEDAVTVSVPAAGSSPGYTVEVATDALTVTTRRAGETVLETASGDTGGLRFKAGDRWHHATDVTDWSWEDGVLVLTADSTLADATVTARLTPRADRYQFQWDVEGGDPQELGLAYDLSSAGHWYGHGEAFTPRGGPGTDQPWPLETGEVADSAFGPASYHMVEPFWYTSSSVGLQVETGDTMDVGINRGRDGLGRFTVRSADEYRATVFVEATPLEVYRDYVGVVGKPRQSDATYEQYAKPLWNSWAQFYTNIDQQKLLTYAQQLKDNGLGGHTIQLDDKWESNYGNLTFDASTFPDPRAMSDRIHDMGFDLGLWVTLWINLDSANHEYAASHGYLLKDADDPNSACEVTWWNGQAGIIDLANPDARAWYVGKLKQLMADYRIDGLKFDTRFFDERCAPRDGLQQADYQKLGAELADEFNLQGAGIRTHWSDTAHQAGFVTRQVDKGTNWESLNASVSQNLAISTVGYPFVESDMIGGSGSHPAPTKEVLVRWAQSASLMPLMYSSTSPVETYDVTTGKKVVYDEETIALYRDAINTHERLAPYIWDQVRATLRTGDPIMRPLFFDFPRDERSYTVDDEWMLGPAVLAAPNLTDRATRDVHLPPGTWRDVNRGRTIHGPATLRGYSAPLGVTPAFVNLDADGAGKALRALSRDGVPAAGVQIAPDGVTTEPGVPVEVTTTVTNWGPKPLRDVRAALDVPAGWTAEAATGAKAASLGSGATLTTTWSVTPARDATWGNHDLVATASYDGGPAGVTDSTRIRVRATPGEVAAPYLTTSTTDAEFARSGEQFAIWAGGQDLSGWKDERGAIYLDGVTGEQATVRTTVVSQEGDTPVSKAGIAVANDLTAPEKGGYAILVMSRSWGLEFLTDSDGDGRLDTWAGGGASYHPAHLKLTRDGTTYTAYASEDGSTWKQVGVAQVPSATGVGDAGMVASAVNLNYPGARTEAIFKGFSVTP